MVFFNWATMQMAAKIVYYGPGLCGKTSNLSYIYTKTSPNSRGEMVSLETESDRTLFFDLLPIEVGTIGGFKTRLQLYTVPGQVFYNTTRKLVLKGVDGMVFVADSQRPMRDANIESFASLKENLTDLGLDFDDMPLVMQYNKRDLTGVLTVDELNADLNPDGKYTFFESSAINGTGVFATLKAITKQTLKKIRKRMAAPQPQPAPQPSKTTSIRHDTAAAVAPQPQPQPSPQQQPAPPPQPKPQPQPQPEPQPQPAPQPQAQAQPQQNPAVAAGQPQETRRISISSLARAAEEGVDDEQPLAAQTQKVEAAPSNPPSEVPVEFDRSEPTPSSIQPPVKRVQVSNQMDILAELDGLRKDATMTEDGKQAKPTPADLDLDSLLTGGKGKAKEVRKKIVAPMSNGVFKEMHSVQVSIQVHNERGEPVKSLEPLSIAIDKAALLKKLTMKLLVEIENKK
jgi:signal recognition particle receptor subunit beta